MLKFVYFIFAQKGTMEKSDVFFFFKLDTKNFMDKTLLFTRNREIFVLTKQQL